jgi:hypothetical protein
MLSNLLLIPQIRSAFQGRFARTGKNETVPVQLAWIALLPRWRHGNCSYAPAANRRVND